MGHSFQSGTHQNLGHPSPTPPLTPSLYHPPAYTAHLSLFRKQPSFRDFGETQKSWSEYPRGPILDLKTLTPRAALDLRPKSR